MHKTAFNSTGSEKTIQIPPDKTSLVPLLPRCTVAAYKIFVDPFDRYSSFYMMDGTV